MLNLCMTCENNKRVSGLLQVKNIYLVVFFGWPAALNFQRRQPVTSFNRILFVTGCHCHSPIHGNDKKTILLSRWYHPSLPLLFRWIFYGDNNIAEIPKWGSMCVYIYSTSSRTFNESNYPQPSLIFLRYHIYLPFTITNLRYNIQSRLQYHDCTHYNCW